MIFGNLSAAGLRVISPAVLGVMLCYVGGQHALLAKDLRSLPEIAIAALLVAVSLAFNNLAAGFLAALAAFYSVRGIRRAAREAA